MSYFVISCGGTGGHLSPGIALAEALIERGHECCLVISKKGVDARLLKKYPQLDFIKLPGSGFSLQPWKLMKFIGNQIIGLYSSIHFLQKKRPDVIVGFGGFITMGIVVAGYLLGCPIVLHEANRNPGKAIRALSALSKRVYLPVGVHLKSLPPKTVRHFGYPLRKEIRKIGQLEARKRLGITTEGKWLLVIGGSQGASILTEWVIEYGEKLGEMGINVYCVTGMQRGRQGKIDYRSSSGLRTQIVFTPFSDNMATLYSCADLVVSRAGAGSIAELVRCCAPSILIPYPWAADNHQLSNASFLEQQGGGIVLSQMMLHKLYSEVLEVINNEWLLDKFRSNLARLEPYSSVDLIADDLEQLCRVELPDGVLHGV
ncbi:MAG: UDP-N-acetylglucosamine--N-acetylmuramyl-(pentapeptide) pyrophosphoryl-undecaprenol N-acetylglucosamine transferase [Verrucomicrobia bacterium CG_4_10_14_3_um_filter_43_23]|nr:MAG: hypothetical protein AUJ82_05950 [Verrucomicrobia bacterium CG1_02_43_26]PIP60042.1 MAG: UDP-N-acetylglucosamine--N-acetylmuramyl-(pentapeptide) pyrophosphoryl-undecaprenol N-acetylglucosamine transferase [Verrucomicrobia bacterium CG22_combo_CG10-13_8_21_14_all_43_17]PIX58108.1 MAG: UDP-N-acetylglucosamine--N-acetylmuramyl-(pentapeptide) pyrophosphoryl-undecaprenol N-acetylglucosamine transferase [Verrucomicrobia bacterium CG_4_10_14_3_um_filter_43_23]PIY63006.1 MAG: UDP-N-acetylglucosa